MLRCCLRLWGAKGKSFLIFLINRKFWCWSNFAYIFTCCLRGITIHGINTIMGSWSKNKKKEPKNTVQMSSGLCSHIRNKSSIFEIVNYSRPDIRYGNEITKKSHSSFHFITFSSNFRQHSSFIAFSPFPMEFRKRFFHAINQAKRIAICMCFLVLFKISLSLISLCIIDIAKQALLKKGPKKLQGLIFQWEKGLRPASMGLFANNYAQDQYIDPNNI